MTLESRALVPPRTSQLIRIRGQVQGIGFRPVIARLAARWRIAGWVANSSDGILIHAEGEPMDVAGFRENLFAECPPEGAVEIVEFVENVALGCVDFRILASDDPASLSTPVPLDRVTCSDCLAEFHSPVDRRAGFFLNSCCRCGPRYSILSKMPYERAQSSMNDFALCAECRHEYEHPEDRRFHAQTTCCPKCGPELVHMEAALEQLRLGQVVIVKGIGGYQLLARATDPLAIARVREYKTRKFKPLAIMVADIETAGIFGELDAGAIRELTSLAGPIVIVPRRRLEPLDEEAIDTLVGGLDSIGLMLPTSLLHRALAEAVGPLIVSSANLEGEPIAYRSAAEIPASLTSVCVTVDHNRPILHPIDDSVVRTMGRQTATIRLARGLAPLPLNLSRFTNGPQVLAVGGHQKVAVALFNGTQAVLGPHLGDMDSLEARRRFEQQVPQWLDLYGCQPQLLAHDAHPDYYTTRWAQAFAERLGIPCIAVQHHAAHCAAALIEPQWCDEPVAAITWDGTGWGSDATIWGGEGLEYYRGQTKRMATLRSFVLPGGTAAIKQPWRIAAAMLTHPEIVKRKFGYRVQQAFDIAPMLERGLGCLSTTSMGRLFDAVAMLILDQQLPGRETDYEGHFAALLESHCDPNATGTYSLPLQTTVGTSNPALQWEWVPLLCEILTDKQAGAAASVMAMRFHRAIATAAMDFIEAVSAERIVLSGGVFQNRVLVETICGMARAQTNKEIAFPGLIPVNDGGLAAGQLVVALEMAVA